MGELDHLFSFNPRPQFVEVPYTEHDEMYPINHIWRVKLIGTRKLKVMHQEPRLF